MIGIARAMCATLIKAQNCLAKFKIHDLQYNFFNINFGPHTTINCKDEINTEPLCNAVFLRQQHKDL